MWAYLVEEGWKYYKIQMLGGVLQNNAFWTWQTSCTQELTEAVSVPVWVGEALIPIPAPVKEILADDSCCERGYQFSLIVWLVDHAIVDGLTTVHIWIAFGLSRIYQILG